MPDKPHGRFARPPTPAPVHVDAEVTPAPSHLPPDPADWNARLDAHEQQLRDLTERAQDAHPGRHDHERVNRLDAKIEAYTQGMTRLEESTKWIVDGQKLQMARLDQCLGALTSVGHLATEVGNLSDKVDGFGDRFGSIHAAQQVAAVRFQEHDERDGVTAESVGRIETRVGAIEQRDHTAKITTALVAKHNKWRPRLLKAIGGAVVAGLGALATLLAGGCV